VNKLKINLLNGRHPKELLKHPHPLLLLQKGYVNGLENIFKRHILDKVWMKTLNNNTTKKLMNFHEIFEIFFGKYSKNIPN
jgi:hypothetical protein